MLGSKQAENLVVPESSFVPTIRSGSCIDISRQEHMEDEHICIDDLSSHLGSSSRCPNPSGFFAVFDGHGGVDAAAYMKKRAMNIFFNHFYFPQTIDPEAVKSCIRDAFLAADKAMLKDLYVNISSGTTALTAFVLRRLLLVANAGDCRAVLCRKGEAIEMSQDHRPSHAAERERIELAGGYFDDNGYLNGILAVTRALGDWDMKLVRKGSVSPLIAEPEFREIVLTEDDEFLVIACDGIWDVMGSREAVGVVRAGFGRHGDPEQCARELVTEALRLDARGNLTVIVVCFSARPVDAISLSATEA